MATSSQTEKRKKLILGALGLLFLVVIVYQFTGSSSEEDSSGQTARTPQPPQRRAAPGQQPRRPATEAEKDAWVQEQLANLSPVVEMRPVSGSADVSPRGNIFAFYVEPPKPPPPPPPPPPITLQGVQPNRSVVAGSPFKIQVLVLGANFPPDAQILFDGRPKATKRVNDHQLSTELEPPEYSAPRSINVEVKSQSDPAKFYSGMMQLNIQQAPEPTFVYRGRHGTSLASIELPASREYKLLKKGDIVEGVWRIDAITERDIEVTHTQFEVKRRRQLQQTR
jgi:hypothetical protein